jgi:hypothetical protein
MLELLHTRDALFPACDSFLGVENPVSRPWQQCKFTTQKTMGVHPADARLDAIRNNARQLYQDDPASNA